MNGGAPATNADGLTFSRWLKKVDQVINKLVGLTTADLADFPSYDMWADSLNPTDAATECLIEWNDLDPDLLDEILAETDL